MVLSRISRLKLVMSILQRIELKRGLIQLEIHYRQKNFIEYFARR